MRKRIFNNWGLKLASLMLAVIIWFLVVQISDPPDTKTFTNIPVKLLNTDLLEKENKVYEVLDKTDTVSVTVRAPKSIIGQLRASDIVAEADVSKLTDINTVAIKYNVQNVEGVETVEGNRDVVRLSVEDRSSKWIKLVHSVVGEVEDNYMVAGTKAELNIIEVSGPKSLVDTISYAGVEIDVTGYSTNLSANVDVALFDKDGNKVENDSIKKSENNIRMEVEVLAMKEVPIEINYMGIPADGYMATGAVLSEPNTVMIAGTTYALSGVGKIEIPEERLNITGESSDMTDIIDLRDYLPDNIILADKDFNGMITATVYIDPIVERVLEIPVENMSIINLPEGWKAEPDEKVEQYRMEVSGLAEYINPLRSAEVRGVVDIAAWMDEEGLTELAPGNYYVPVKFELGNDVKTEGVKMQLTIAEME